MLNNLIGLFMLFICSVKCSLLPYNRLIRVDGINPTCLPLSDCKEYKEVGAVISVDKSLPFMGSNYCCFKFKIPDEHLKINSHHNHNPLFIGRILNTTVLKGDDYITFFDGESLEMNTNFTSNTTDLYVPLFFKSPIVYVEIYKDRNFRSIYEISITMYYKGESPECKTKAYHRCSSNTSLCISQKLTCDKFSHCPSESDEVSCDLNIGNYSEVNEFTVLVIVGIIATTFISTTVIIIVLTFCDDCQTKLSKSMIAIFSKQYISKANEFINEENLSLNAQQTYA